MTDNAEVVLDSVNLKYESTATLKVSDRNNWALKLRILLEPKFMENGIQLIGPPGLLVVVSWVSNFAHVTSLTPFTASYQSSIFRSVIFYP